MTTTTLYDKHGNKFAREGVDRCECGCKYWENDRCHDCGAEHPDASNASLGSREFRGVE